MTHRLDHRFAVAPMMDWTDRHCRFFHRLLAPKALLYTEMVTSAAVVFGDRERLLGFSPAEQPAVLQLGGSEPDEVGRAVEIADAWGYAGFNLNCGCPSSRVQKGAFGACLMAEPERVRGVLEAMRAATDREVSVKCRIAIDDQEPAPFLDRFVVACADAGVTTFIVHARTAWLKGLSPKENREVPPLRYDVVANLKAHYPELRIVLNGGLSTTAQIGEALRWADGVMIGREAYRNPGALPTLDAAARGCAAHPIDESALIATLAAYVERAQAQGVPPSAVLRHVLGLFAGRPGARLWRRCLSEHMHRTSDGAALLREAASLLLLPAAA